MSAVLLIPAYNSESTIAETIASILAQGENLERLAEVIIADDASTDRTREIARADWTAATPLRVLEPARNRGEYVNVTETVESLDSSVEWFLIMHADNVAKEGWLAALLDQLHGIPHNIATICTSWDDWYEDGSIKPGEHLKTPYIDVPASRAAVRKTLFQGCWWHISSCAIRVSAFREVGGLPRGLRLKGDWDLLLRFQAGGWGIRYIPRALMLYRQNPVGSSSLTFAKHHDIREILQVVRWHRAALSGGDVVRLHAAQFVTPARRAVRSALTMNLRRMLATLPMAVHVLGSLQRSLQSPERRKISSL